MANPPITIGPFDNVPAPGSAIKSDWPQELTTEFVKVINAGKTFMSAIALTLGASTVGAAGVTVGSIVVPTVAYKQFVIAYASALASIDVAAAYGNLSVGGGAIAVRRYRLRQISQPASMVVATIGVNPASTPLTINADFSTNVNATCSFSGSSDYNALVVLAVGIQN